MNKVKEPQLNPYERLYGRKLSEDKVAEMKTNLIGFFSLLIEIDRENHIVNQEENNLTKGVNNDPQKETGPVQY